MNIDYDITHVKNMATRCWRESPYPEDEGFGRFVLQIDTEALIWGAHHLALRCITKANVGEWHFRIQFLKRLGVSWAQLFVDDDIVFTYPTRDQISDHIGLKTNVQKIARRKWIANISRQIELEVERQLEKEK